MLNMNIWLLLFLGTAVYGKSRISQPGFQAVNFAKAIEGRKLNGSLINETEVDSEISCQFKCVKEMRCQSYNFGFIKNISKRFMCQLSHSDRFVGHASFTEDEDFKYIGIQVYYVIQNLKVRISFIFLIFSIDKEL